MAKSVSANLFRTVWIYNFFFFLIPIPTSKRKKEDLPRAGKAPGNENLHPQKR